MMTTVKAYGEISEILGKREVSVPISGEMTILDFLTSLSREYGKRMHNYLFDEKGSLRSHLTVLKNGRFSSSDMKITDNDELCIIPPVAGG